jgi:hypothetical protein
MEWTVSRLRVPCGAASGCVIEPGDPVQVLAEGRLRRCRQHADGPVDWQAIDIAHFRLRTDERARVARTVHAAARAPYRHRPTRLQPAAAVAELRDPRRLAAGDYDDET